MINIQSYKDITINLSESINVFEAPNETGKSIIFKVFRVMCDANWFGRGERKSLIRRGCDKGTALIVVPYSDGNFKIVFEIHKTYQVYYLFDNDKQLDSWKQDTIPSELIEILGWYYDKDSKILLNLCDQELDMPFVNSNLRFNYEVMKFIIKNNELETSRDNLEKWIKTNSEELESLNTRILTLEGIISNYKYVDIDVISNSIEKRENISRKTTALVNILESLDNISKLDKPQFNKINSERVEELISNAEKVRNVGITLQNMLNLTKPTINKIDGEHIENLIDTSKCLNNILFSLYKLRDSIIESNKTYMMLKNSVERLEDFENSNKICPLCGNSIEHV